MCDCFISASKFLVVGGLTDVGFTSVVEIISLNEPSKSCRLPDFPVQVAYATGGFTSEGPTVCTGFNSSVKASDECFTMRENASFQRLPFRLKEKRKFASSVVTPDGDLLVFGGINENNALLDSIEKLSSSGSEMVSQNLPKAISSHCALLINKTTALVVGGYADSDGTLSKSHYIDLTMFETKPGPEMKQPRYGHGCVVSDKKILVAGGRNGKTLI